MSNKLKDVIADIEKINKKSKYGKLVATYLYKSEHGMPFYYRARFETDKGKKIIPFHYKKEKNKLVLIPTEPPFKEEGISKPLYNLNKLFTSRRSRESVLIVEGEKCADILKEMVPFVTTAGAATDINRTDWSILKERDVVLWPDNDEAGIKAFDALALKLKTKFDCRVKIVDISALDLPHKGDVEQWLEKNPNGDISSLKLIEFEAPKAEHPIKEEKKSKDEPLNKEEEKKEEEAEESLISIIFDNEYPTNVSRDEVYRELFDQFLKYTRMSDNQLFASMAWCRACYSYDSSPQFPPLLVTAALKGSGKTTLLQLLSYLCPKTKILDGQSTIPFLTEVIDKYRPTLIVDEGDTYLKDRSSDLCRLIIAASQKGGTIGKMMPKGRGYVPRELDVGTPMAIGMNGLPPNTILDRAITIKMKRSNSLIPFFNFDQKEEMSSLRQKMKRIDIMDKEELNKTNWNSVVTMLPGKNQRVSKAWVMKLRIMQIAGKEWEQRCIESFKEVAGYDGGKKEINVMLLEDIRDYINLKTDKMGSCPHNISSEYLCFYLRNLDDRPWKTYNSRVMNRANSDFDPENLASILRSFDLKSEVMPELSSKAVRVNSEDINRANMMIVKKGYPVGELKEFFDIYLD